MTNVRKKYCRAAVAAVLSGLLGLEPALVSAGEGNLWNDRRKAMSASRAPEPENPSNTLLASLPSIANPVMNGTGIKNTAAGLARLDMKGSIPEWIQTAVTPFATIQTAKLSAGDKRPTVVLIQDAHLHNEAQHHIGGVVEALGKQAQAQGGRLLVGLEGAAAGPIDMSGYRSEHPDVMKEIAWAFEEAHVLSGAEAAAISNAGTPGATGLVDLVGTENFDLYTQNVKALRDAVPFEKSAKAALSDFRRELVELKKKNFDANLLRFDSRKDAYELGGLSLPDYAIYLDSVVTATSPNLRELIEAALIEGSLKFDRVEVERKKLLGELLPKLSDGELKGLLQASVMFRAAQLTYSAYYDQIKGLAERHKLPLSRFPEMNVYIQYVLKSEAIDHRRLFEEIRSLEGTVRTHLSSTDQQRAVLDLNDDYHLMVKLVDRALIESEWHAYEARQPEVAKILDRLAAAGGGKPPSLMDMAPKWKTFGEFYDAALKRNFAMTDNFAAEIEKSGAKHAMIVVGGFHSEGLAALLEKKNFNVLVLSPKITKQSDGPSSLDFLAAGRLPLDEIFSGQKLFLPTPMQLALAGPAQFLRVVIGRVVAFVIRVRAGGKVPTDTGSVGDQPFEISDGKNGGDIGNNGGGKGPGGGTIVLPPLADGTTVVISKPIPSRGARFLTWAGRGGGIGGRTFNLIAWGLSWLRGSQSKAVGKLTMTSEDAPVSQRFAELQRSLGVNLSDLGLMPGKSRENGEDNSAAMGYSRGMAVLIVAFLFIFTLMSGMNMDMGMSLNSVGTSVIAAVFLVATIAFAIVMRVAKTPTEKKRTMLIGMAALLLTLTGSGFFIAMVLALAATVLLTTAEEVAHIQASRGVKDAQGQAVNGYGQTFNLSTAKVDGIGTIGVAKTKFRGQLAFFLWGSLLFGAMGFMIGTSGLELPLVGIISPLMGIFAGIIAVLGLTLLNKEYREWRAAVAREGLKAIGITWSWRENIIRPLRTSRVAQSIASGVLTFLAVGAGVALFAPGAVALGIGGAVGLLVTFVVGGFIRNGKGQNIISAHVPNAWAGTILGSVATGLLTAGLASIAVTLLGLATPAWVIYLAAVILGFIGGILQAELYPKEGAFQIFDKQAPEYGFAVLAIGVVGLAFTGGLAAVLSAGSGIVFFSAVVFFIIAASSVPIYVIAYFVERYEKHADKTAADAEKKEKKQKEEADRVAAELAAKDARTEANRQFEHSGNEEVVSFGRFYSSLLRFKIATNRNEGKPAEEQEQTLLAVPRTIEEAKDFYLALAAFYSESDSLADGIMRKIRERISDPAMLAFHDLTVDALKGAGSETSSEAMRKGFDALMRELHNATTLTEEQKTAVATAWVLARRDNSDLAAEVDGHSSNAFDFWTKPSPLMTLLFSVKIALTEKNGQSKLFTLAAVVTATRTMKNAQSAVVSALAKFVEAFKKISADAIRDINAAYNRALAVAIAADDSDAKRSALQERFRGFIQLGYPAMQDLGERLAKSLFVNDDDRGPHVDGVESTLKKLLDTAEAQAAALARVAFPEDLYKGRRAPAQIAKLRAQFVAKLVGKMLAQSAGEMSDTVYDLFKNMLPADNAQLRRAAEILGTVSPSAKPSAKVTTSTGKPSTKTPAEDAKVETVTPSPDWTDAMGPTVLPRSTSTSDETANEGDGTVPMAPVVEKANPRRTSTSDEKRLLDAGLANPEADSTPVPGVDSWVATALAWSRDVLATLVLATTLDGIIFNLENDESFASKKPTPAEIAARRAFASALQDLRDLVNPTKRPQGKPKTQELIAGLEALQKALQPLVAIAATGEAAKAALQEVKTALTKLQVSKTKKTVKIELPAEPSDRDTLVDSGYALPTETGDAALVEVMVRWRTLNPLVGLLETALKKFKSPGAIQGAIDALRLAVVTGKGVDEAVARAETVIKRTLTSIEEVTGQKASDARAALDKALEVLKTVKITLEGRKTRPGNPKAKAPADQSTESPASTPLTKETRTALSKAGINSPSKAGITTEEQALAFLERSGEVMEVVKLAGEVEREQQSGFSDKEFNAALLELITLLATGKADSAQISALLVRIREKVQEVKSPFETPNGNTPLINIKIRLLSEAIDKFNAGKAAAPAPPKGSTKAATEAAKPPQPTTGLRDATLDGYVDTHAGAPMERTDAQTIYRSILKTKAEGKALQDAAERAAYMQAVAEMITRFQKELGLDAKARDAMLARILAVQGEPDLNAARDAADKLLKDLQAWADAQKGPTAAAAKKLVSFARTQIETGYPRAVAAKNQTEAPRLSETTVRALNGIGILKPADFGITSETQAQAILDRVRAVPGMAKVLTDALVLEENSKLVSTERAPKFRSALQAFRTAIINGASETEVGAALEELRALTEAYQKKASGLDSNLAITLLNAINAVRPARLAAPVQPKAPAKETAKAKNEIDLESALPRAPEAKSDAGTASSGSSRKDPTGKTSADLDAVTAGQRGDMMKLVRSRENDGLPDRKYDQMTARGAFLEQLHELINFYTTGMDEVGDIYQLSITIKRLQGTPDDKVFEEGVRQLIKDLGNKLKAAAEKRAASKDQVNAVLKMAKELAVKALAVKQLKGAPAVVVDNKTAVAELRDNFGIDAERFAPEIAAAVLAQARRMAPLFIAIGKMDDDRKREEALRNLRNVLVANAANDEEALVPVLIGQIRDIWNLKDLRTPALTNLGLKLFAIDLPKNLTAEQKRNVLGRLLEVRGILFGQFEPSVAKAIKNELHALALKGFEPVGANFYRDLLVLANRFRTSARRAGLSDPVARDMKSFAAALDSYVESGLRKTSASVLNPLDNRALSSLPIGVEVEGLGTGALPPAFVITEVVTVGLTQTHLDGTTEVIVKAVVKIQAVVPSADRNLLESLGIATGKMSPAQIADLVVRAKAVAPILELLKDAPGTYNPNNFSLRKELLSIISVEGKPLDRLGIALSTDFQAVANRLLRALEAVPEAFGGENSAEKKKRLAKTAENQAELARVQAIVARALGIAKKLDPSAKTDGTATASAKALVEPKVIPATRSKEALPKTLAAFFNNERAILDKIVAAFIGSATPIAALVKSLKGLGSDAVIQRAIRILEAMPADNLSPNALFNTLLPVFGLSSAAADLLIKSAGFRVEGEIDGQVNEELSKILERLDPRISADVKIVVGDAGDEFSLVRREDGKIVIRIAESTINALAARFEKEWGVGNPSEARRIAIQHLLIKEIAAGFLGTTPKDAEETLRAREVGFADPDGPRPPTTDFEKLLKEVDDELPGFLKAPAEAAAPGSANPARTATNGAIELERGLDKALTAFIAAVAAQFSVNSMTDADLAALRSAILNRMANAADSDSVYSIAYAVAQERTGVPAYKSLSDALGLLGSISLDSAARAVVKAKLGATQAGSKSSVAPARPKPPAVLKPSAPAKDAAKELEDQKAQITDLRNALRAVAKRFGLEDLFIVPGVVPGDLSGEAGLNILLLAHGGIIDQRPSEGKQRDLILEFLVSRYSAIVFDGSATPDIERRHGSAFYELLLQNSGLDIFLQQIVGRDLVERGKKILDLTGISDTKNKDIQKIRTFLVLVRIVAVIQSQVKGDAGNLSVATFLQRVLDNKNPATIGSILNELGMGAVASALPEGARRVRVDSMDPGVTRRTMVTFSGKAPRESTAQVSFGRRMVLGLLGLALLGMSILGVTDVNSLIAYTLIVIAAIAAEEFAHFRTGARLGLSPNLTSLFSVRFGNEEKVRTPIAMIMGPIGFFLAAVAGVAVFAAISGGMPLFLGGLAASAILAFSNREFITAAAAVKRNGVGTSLNALADGRAGTIRDLIVKLGEGTVNPILTQMFDAMAGRAIFVGRNNTRIEFGAKGHLSEDQITALAADADASDQVIGFISFVNKHAQNATDTTRQEALGKLDFVGTYEDALAQPNSRITDPQNFNLNDISSVQLLLERLTTQNANGSKIEAVLATPAELLKALKDFQAFANKNVDKIRMGEDRAADRAEKAIEALEQAMAQNFNSQSPAMTVNLGGRAITLSFLTDTESTGFKGNLTLTNALIETLRARISGASTGLTPGRTVVYSSRQLITDQINATLVMVMTMYQPIGDQLKAAAIVAIQA